MIPCTCVCGGGSPQRTAYLAAENKKRLFVGGQFTSLPRTAYLAAETKKGKKNVLVTQLWNSKRHQKMNKKIKTCYVVTLQDLMNL